METKNQKSKPAILIVDDSEFNRQLVSEILEDAYSIIEAENGKQALDIISERLQDLSCVLLDISMSVMNGFEVLEIMNAKKWIQSLPVIIISSLTGNIFTQKGYSLGVSDYVFRPFDEMVLKKRVQNIVNLYAKQKKLEEMIVTQVNENERLSDMMISILGHTVEFRNKESNLHIANVSSLTKIIINELKNISPKYNFDKNTTKLISRAAALHDLGKVSIPDEILNKPGRFTPEEFDIMKTHTVAGSQMLENEVIYKDEPLVKYAYEICRWHHERYDGRGYPDGLRGDDIPIAAQIVSLADVYDALTSERCYKKSFTHEQAINMITNNECGVFNPDLMTCLNNISSTLQIRLKAEVESLSKPDLSLIDGI